MRRRIMSARWSRSAGEERSFVFLHFGSHTRKLRGDAAEWLATWPLGRITFLPKRPRDLYRRLAVIGVPQGILVALYTSSYGTNAVLVGQVKMCDQWRRAFGVSRSGQVRWATVRGREVVV